MKKKALPLSKLVLREYRSSKDVIDFLETLTSEFSIQKFGESIGKSIDKNDIQKAISKLEDKKIDENEIQGKIENIRNMIFT